MQLRDRVERLLAAWNAYEISINAPAIIDYDCRPNRDDVRSINGRVDVYRQFESLRAEAESLGAKELVQSIDCHCAYIESLLGERPTLADYVVRTQGCEVTGWSDEYIHWRGEQARECLEELGIKWGLETGKDLRKSEQTLESEQVSDALRVAAKVFEPAVRSSTGTAAPYNLKIETTDVDAYWGYWLDGAGQDARLRLNLRNTNFTDVQARQFAFHEILGHALQSASYSARCESEDVPWVRILSVHANHQVVLEGLAQAFPLFCTPDDQQLIARVRLDHYLELVHAQLHLAVNNNQTVADCIELAKSFVPFWTEEQIGRRLADRSNDILLRSYHWAYPAGVDWFVRLAESQNAETISAVLGASYRDPLTPRQLQSMWPAGPRVGGEHPHS